MASRPGSGAGPSEDVFVHLFGLAPQARMVAGGICFAAGALATWALWEAGWIWSLSLLPVAFGIALVASGLGDWRQEKAIRAEWRRARAQRERLVASMVEVKQRGERPSFWLLDQGFREAGVRRWLMARMREAMGE